MRIVEAAVAIAPRWSVRASEISVLVARTPFWFVARFPFTPSFAAIAMPFVRLVASRNKLRLRFIGFTVAKPMPRQPIAILFEHAVVVLRALAVRFVRPIFARAPRWLRL